MEDIIPLIKYQPPSIRSNKKETEEEKAIREQFKDKGLDDTSIHTLQSISRSSYIDYQVRFHPSFFTSSLNALTLGAQLIAAVVNHIISTASKTCGILIFLPGVQEIRGCIDAMRGVISGSKVDILPLHANLTSEKQRRVFFPTPRWKIIAATNVAEVCWHLLLNI